MKVKIYGAGSIGNHHANACSSLGWDVTVCDIDVKALERMKKEIYPERYGSWNNRIKLYTLNDCPMNEFDLVIIGTPPDSHLKILKDVIVEQPKAILIEKPFCTPYSKNIFSGSGRATLNLF